MVENILWKKSPQTQLFVDIFAIKRNEISLTEIENMLQTKKKDYIIEKNDLLATACREAGKAYFSSGDYVTAMKVFNNCLCVAENGSKEVGLAYANRSACFFQMNMLRECLADIEMAKNSNYPAHLMHKLDARVSKCKNLMQDYQFNTKPCNIREPSLSFNEHKKYAGVADCLEIRKNDKFGRHIITTCDLKIGQTILVEEPFSTAGSVRVGENRDRCLGCSKYAMNFITCENCINGLHCNEDCMKNAFHKIVCDFPSPFNKQEVLELVIKTTINAIIAFSDVDKMIDTVEILLKGQDTPDLTKAAQKNFCMLFQLVNHYEKVFGEKLNELRTLAAYGFVCITRSPDFKNKFTLIKHRRFLQHLILHFLHTADINAISLYENLQIESSLPLGNSCFSMYAYGMYPFGCCINHSCLPNVWIIPIDDRLICKVIRPIKNGEQIFRSYLYPYEDSFRQNAVRKTNLEERFYMKCECVLCSDDTWTTLLHEVSLKQSPLWKDAIAPVNMTAKAFRNLSRETQEHYENRAIKFLEMYNRFHPLKDSMNVQWGLIIMWTLLATRF